MINKIIITLKNHKLKILFIILLSLFLPLISNFIPEISSSIVNEILAKNIKNIIIFSFILIILYTFKTLLLIVMQNKIVKLNIAIMNNLKKDITTSIINQPLVFHDNVSSQYILSRINEANNFSKLFSVEIFSFFTNVLSAVVAFIMIINKNILLAIVSIIMLPFFALLSQRLLNKMNGQIHKSLEASAKTDEILHSTLSGTMALKQFNEEDSILKNVFNSMDDLSKKLVIQNITLNKSGNLITLFTYTMQTILLLIVAILITQNKLSIGEYVSMGQYFGLLYAPALSMQVINLNLKPALVSMRRMDSFIPMHIKEKKKEIKEINKIEVQNLEFFYNEHKVFDKINFSLSKGDKILITGKNGSGKTTLAKILCGFYDNYSGNIFYDGIEPNEVKEECIRSHVAMLSQKNYLFDATIKENIRMSNRTINDKEFEAKIEHMNKIGLLQNINLNDRIIENGKKLSGGQIQRISLARILMRKADIYIFDEFTNSLDIETKMQIKKILMSEFNDKICIFIMHDEHLNDIVNKIQQI